MVDVVNFNGDNDLVIQSTDINGTKIEERKSFKSFVRPFSPSYQVQIENLQDTIEDKKRLNGFINKEVLELYLKKEKIENEKVNKEQQVAHLLKELNGKNINDTSSLFQQAINYFIEGDIDTALSVLAEAKIQKETKEDVSIKQKAETRILKARLLIIKNKFDEAGENYEKALNHFTDWESSLEAANFFRIFDNNKATHYCQISLTEANTDYEKILSLNILALIHKANNNFKDADELLNEAFQLSKKFNKTESEADLSYYAMVLHNIGNQWIDKSELSKAEECYKIVLKIRKQLEENNPKKYTYQVAETAHNLGIVNKHLIDYKNARNYLQEAEEIFEDLAKNVSINYYLNLALTRRDIALLESKDQIKTKDEVEELYLNALDVFSKLPKPIQETNQAKAFIVGFYNNLGVFQKNNQEESKANTSFKKSLTIAKELSEQNPSRYLPEVASAHHNIGNNFAKTHNYTNAEKHLKKALDIYKEFSDLIPEKFEVPLAQAYMCLGLLYNYGLINNEELFHKYLTKSIELYEKYAYKIKEVKNWLIDAKHIYEDWLAIRMKEMEKLIDEDFDEYDEVFKALA